MLSGLIALVVYIIVIGLIVWLLLYLIEALPLPAPFGQIARVVVIAIAVLFVIMLLLSLVGEGPALPRLR
jgi:hypothetical protein